MSGVVSIETTINIEIEQGDGVNTVLMLTLDQARALKDELIRAVGAQNPPGYAPVLRPVGGFVNDHPGEGPFRIPEHLLKRARDAGERNKVAHQERQCHCGDSGWGDNGCCGTSGCNNVPG